MTFLKHNRTNTKESLKAFLAITLLALYFIGNTPVEIIHQFFHAHETVVAHSVEQEKDPCHVSLFHEGRDGSCDHETHLLKVEKCSLSHLILHNDHIALSNFSCESVYPYFFINERVISGVPHDIAVQLPSRAPPVSFSV